MKYFKNEFVNCLSFGNPSSKSCKNNREPIKITTKDWERKLFTLLDPRVRVVTLFSLGFSFGILFCHQWGRIWSYRALVKANCTSILVFDRLVMVPRPESFKKSKNAFLRFLKFFWFFYAFFLEKDVWIGSGEVGGGPYFVRMFSYGPRMLWDRFWPKIHRKTMKKQKIPKFPLPNFPYFPVFSGFFWGLGQNKIEAPL